ncbi:hypothetical protein ACIPR8_16985 [Stenotrophomonas sp. LARHCG68]
MIARILCAVLLAVGLMAIPSGEAAAQDYSACYDRRLSGSPEVCPDQGTAYQQALVLANYFLSSGCAGIGGSSLSIGNTSVDESGRLIRIYVKWVSTGANVCSADRRWVAGKSCAQSADMVNVSYQTTAGGTCSGGCEYVPVVGAGETFRNVTLKGVSFTRASRMAPNGGVCSIADYSPPSTGGEDQCIEDGTLTQCVKSDGTICTGKNKQFCFKPGESGIKTSGNEAASNIPEGKDSKLPPVPPANGGDWEKIADALVSISETKGGTTTTNNSTINNYNSSYGSSGSGASGNGASGESNGGSGDGSGSGSGDGEGGGDGNDPGGAGSGVGTLYEGTGDTVAGVFDQFKARVGNSPLIAATRDFFTVHGGGSCPVFTVPASTYWESMTYDGHCSGDFLAALKSIGWVLMAIAALAAAYWALS